jgi:hypothetical protein
MILALNFLNFRSEFQFQKYKCSVGNWVGMTLLNLKRVFCGEFIICYLFWCFITFYQLIVFLISYMVSCKHM